MSLALGTGPTEAQQPGADVPGTSQGVRGEPGLAALELSPVDVIGVRARPTGVVGPPPPAYAGGQVGGGTRVGLLGDRSVFDTPFSSTGYTEQLIRDQQARTVADVAANDPSVRSLLQRNSFSDQFFIRASGSSRSTSASTASTD